MALIDDRTQTLLLAIDRIGIEQITFETDYPHQDSTWPHTLEAVRKFAPSLREDELAKVLRLNALTLVGR